MMSEHKRLVKHMNTLVKENLPSYTLPAAMIASAGVGGALGGPVGALGGLSFGTMVGSSTFIGGHLWKNTVGQKKRTKR
jgi:hypothetical protein